MCLCVCPLWARRPEGEVCLCVCPLWARRPEGEVCLCVCPLWARRPEGEVCLCVCMSVDAPIPPPPPPLPRLSLCAYLVTLGREAGPVHHFVHVKIENAADVMYEANAKLTEEGQAGS